MKKWYFEYFIADYFLSLFYEHPVLLKYYDKPVPNEETGDGNYAMDKFPYADLKPSYNLSKDTVDYNTKQ